ncbi:MAG: hypothetical protein WAX69_17375, partial [Victivallales bacterium]
YRDQNWLRGGFGKTDLHVEFVNCAGVTPFPAVPALFPRCRQGCRRSMPFRSQQITTVLKQE